MRTVAIIPSGGKGLRVSNDLPKQYMKIAGKELLYYSLKIFQDSEDIEDIVVAAQAQFIPQIEDLIGKYSLDKVTGIVEGGSTRQDSVFNAFKSLTPSPDTYIVVHDAARPFLTPGILHEGIKMVKKHNAVVTAIPASDTLLKAEEENVSNYLDRNSVYYVQTPQFFSYELLDKAFKKAYEENFQGTDESMLVKRAGFEVKLLPGSVFNFKITTKDDLIIADNILRG